MFKWTILKRLKGIKKLQEKMDSRLEAIEKFLTSMPDVGAIADAIVKVTSDKPEPQK